MASNTQHPLIQRIEQDMVFVEGGEFMMGGKRMDREKPIHRVVLDDFHIGRFPVTQALWEAVMGENPAFFQGKQRPVERVSWNRCQEFIQKLNSFSEKFTYRLPTEAEWEYAARGGKYEKELQALEYAGSNQREEVAWWRGNSHYGSMQVGEKRPNALGLYDMSGNVYEWCQDWFGDADYYQKVLDKKLDHNPPRTPMIGTRRVVRGGSWDSVSMSSTLRVAYRYYGYPPARCQLLSSVFVSAAQISLWPF